MKKNERNNIMKIYLYIFTTILLYSCSNEKQFKKSKKTFYNSGKIKSEFVFNNYDDYNNNNNYKEICYYENGKIKYKRNVVNHKNEGYTFYYKTNEAEMIITYENGQQHGLSLETDIRKRKLTEYLYKHNKLILSKRYYISDNGYYCEILKDTTKAIGKLFFDKDYNIIRGRNEFYYVYGKDTIYNADKTFKLEVFRFGNTPTYIKLGINNDTTSIEKSKTLDFKLKPYKKGVNVFFGELKYEYDTIINGDTMYADYNFPFHHQYVYLGDDF